METIEILRGLVVCDRVFTQVYVDHNFRCVNELYEKAA